MRRHPEMKRLLWSGYLIVAVACSATILFAPQLGLGQGYHFVLYRHLGVTREMGLQLLLWPGVFSLLYEFLAAGVSSPPDRSRILAVLKAAWADGTAIARSLFSETRQPITRRELRIAIWLVAAFAAAFALFLSKSLVWFKSPPEQHWWQAMLDYGIDWGTPIFSLGANVLYNFGVQTPLKGQLLPMEGTAHLFPVQFRIAATVTLCFFSTAALFWCIGAVVGLKPIYRIVFGGSLSLLTTIPVGLNYVLWFLPPRFFTYQFTFAMWWGEAPILLLTAVLLFLLVGRQRSPARNLCASAGFAAGAFAVILSYPVGVIYFVPLMALYCLGLFLTCESRAEFQWKANVSVVIAAVMMIARVPQFLANLYGYSFGAYFFDFSPEPPAGFEGSSLLAMSIYHLKDPRALLSFVIAFGALATAALMAKGTLRRIAVAALVCEAGIVAAMIINLSTWKVPLPGTYAELGNAPMWGAFFVLSMIIVGMLIDQRLVTWGGIARAKYSSLIQRVIHHRRWLYGSFLVLATAGSWLFQVPPAKLSDYPPRRTPSIELLTRELALAPGSQFRGRLMTVVPATLPGPATVDYFYEIVSNRYRRYLGNDYWIDPSAFNIPTLNESHYFTSPPSFAITRIFFGKEGDGFGRTTILFTRFDLRIARLVGVRIVATDAPAIPGGALIYETKAGDTDLRIFRIEETNVGQYSPTRIHRVETAAEAITAIRAADFDPKRDVVVESEVADGLTPASSAAVTVDLGPTLIVRATSPGRSLLILPFDYSHCLRLETGAGSGRLIPVNLQQTGLLFEERVEARITYRFGLFQDSRCRAQDLRRADDLQIKDALVRNNRATLIRRRPSLW
jgi:hypothetical protein